MLESLETGLDLDATEFVWRYERCLVRHIGRMYKKFIKWKQKTRFKKILSNNALKEMWKFFVFLFARVKEIRKFTLVEGDQILNLIHRMGPKKLV
jgi:hypothetical protein